MQFSDLTKEVNLRTTESDELATSSLPENIVSFQAEVPNSIQLAMTNFIEEHPRWDQYRLVQAALAGFLVQNGDPSREVTRLYVENMFGARSF